MPSRRFYNRTMATTPTHDWFLRQWIETLQTTQAELERRTGWDKRKVSYLINGKQPYKRDTVNEAAFALNIEPFELLMHPEDAFALRRLRENAMRIASQSHSPYRPAPVHDDTKRRVNENG
ncbi:helix-turn-helix transcriptional regulator [Novosphingobium profundi]|uniref:helix-turn-helix domain-containing protein n=1 Tax=Novosphingobium profundi TaxID=1774954 RepID=UPI001BDB5FCC|nr:helix-turn-helix transcriptional regulator [Novosphingobium profundi]MBT0667054.1 helix-turn-helix transcriptional regulator [Novosphingobium profundi]